MPTDSADPTEHRPAAVAATRATSTPEQLALKLRALIVRGELAPGAPLREIALAEETGVSRNTVRAALQVLVRDGLVVHHRHRGAAVVDPSPEDVIDVFRTRELLELGAVDSWRQAPPERRLAVERAMSAFEASAAGTDWLEISDADLGFHAALVGLLGSRRIDAFYDTVRTEVYLYTSMLYRGNQPWEDPREVAAEHVTVLDELLADRVAEARAALHRLLSSNRARLLELIAERRGAAG